MVYINLSGGRATRGIYKNGTNESEAVFFFFFFSFFFLLRRAGRPLATHVSLSLDTVSSASHNHWLDGVRSTRAHLNRLQSSLESSRVEANMINRRTSGHCEWTNRPIDGPMNEPMDQLMDRVSFSKRGVHVAVVYRLLTHRHSLVGWGR